MIKSLQIAFLFLMLGVPALNAQFAPQFPLEGNEAIHKSDSKIKAWATGAVVERGWMNIADTTLGRATTGSADNAKGVSNVTVVSLGDGGTAVLTFSQAIKNGEGADFVVFENAFADPLDASMAFLELAFVEVSTDGINYVRFPAICNLQTDSQVTNETYSDATFIHNLAGKYLSNYGTPFDLEELKDSVGIDIDNINYVRIVDVVGSLDSNYASFDSRGMLINDPWPTPFPQSGFDLEAIGVIHPATTSSILNTELASLVVLFPNPSNGTLNIQIPNTDSKVWDYQIYDIKGSVLQIGKIQHQSVIDISGLTAASYFLKIGNMSLPFVKL